MCNTLVNNCVQVGRTQEAGTITEPDSLGPCEPGTTINLDGIVWNETKGGKGNKAKRICFDEICFRVAIPQYNLAGEELYGNINGLLNN